MYLDIANCRRRSLINGNLLSFFRDTGVKRTHWVQVWPTKAYETKDLKRIARAWIDKCKLPVAKRHILLGEPTT